MTEEQAPIKIVIPVEDEIPLVPERSRPGIKANIRQAGRQFARRTGSTTRKAWHSSAREKATSSIKEGAKAVATAGGRVVHSAVIQTTERQVKKRAAAARTRLEATDWRIEAKMGTGKGLRWLSRRLARLAERLTPVDPGHSQTKDGPAG